MLDLNSGLKTTTLDQKNTKIIWKKYGHLCLTYLPFKNWSNFFPEKNMASVDPTYAWFDICPKFRSFFLEGLPNTLQWPVCLGWYQILQSGSVHAVHAPGPLSTLDMCHCPIGDSLRSLHIPSILWKHNLKVTRFFNTFLNLQWNLHLMNKLGNIVGYHITLFLVKSSTQKYNERSLSLLDSNLNW